MEIHQKGVHYLHEGKMRGLVTVLMLARGSVNFSVRAGDNYFLTIFCQTERFVNYHCRRGEYVIFYG